MPKEKWLFNAISCSRSRHRKSKRIILFQLCFFSIFRRRLEHQRASLCCVLQINIRLCHSIPTRFPSPRHDSLLLSILRGARRFSVVCRHRQAAARRLFSVPLQFAPRRFVVVVGYFASRVVFALHHIEINQSQPEPT